MKISISKAMLVFSLLMCVSVAAAADDTKLRAEVTKYLASLKAAYEGGDRDKVLTHFQFGELVPPSDSEYRMLGQLGFWNKPVKSITSQADGVIRVEFTMDPESDMPAQFLTLEFIREGGRLMVKSSLSADEVERARQARQQAAKEEKATAAFGEELKKRKAITSWPLVDAFVKETTARHGPIPEGIEIFGMAELYRGDEAMLILTVAESSDFRELWPALFKKEKGVWKPEEADEKTFEAWTDPAKLRTTKVTRRPPGIPMEQFAQFLQYVTGMLAPRFRQALDGQNWKECAAIVDEAMVGFALRDAAEVVEMLRKSWRPVESVKLVKQEPMGEMTLTEFSIVQEGEPVSRRWYMTKEGDGWVLFEPYFRRGAITLSRMRSLAVAMEAYAFDHGDAFPPADTPEALKAALSPTYIREVPLLDAWDTPFKITVGKDRKSYRIVSAGADRRFDPASWESEAPALADLNQDAVCETGGVLKRMWKGSD